MKESCQIDESNICNMAGVQLREFKEYDELVEELFNAVSSVLQCVAVCCSVLQCVVVCCSMLQCVAVCCSLLYDDGFLEDVFNAVSSVLQCVAVCVAM